MPLSIVDCPICARLPQKSAEERMPKGADKLADAGADTKRCPECGTLYSYSYDDDPGEPMVPATETYTLMRLTPVLARAEVGDTSSPDPTKWAALHETLAAAIPTLASPHIIKHVVESLTDYYLETSDRAAFVRTLLQNPRPSIRANAAADFLFVATEEYQVWTVRAFSRHQQKLAAPWLGDPAVTTAVLEALVSCLDADEETVNIDSNFGNQAAQVCDVAYHGLSNAFYRKLDPSPVMPALQALAAGSTVRGRDRARRLLEELKGSR